MARDRIWPNKRGASCLFLGGIRVGVPSEGMIMSDTSDPWMTCTRSPRWICHHRSTRSNVLYPLHVIGPKGREISILMTAPGQYAPILRIVLIRFRTGDGKIDGISLGYCGSLERSWHARGFWGSYWRDPRRRAGWIACKEGKDGVSNRDAVPYSIRNEVHEWVR